MSQPKAFFLPAEAGYRYCIYHRAGRQDGAGRGIVYAHPFCEEMNKARRMAAMQSRELAAAGIAVLQIDLFGCGDSSGDFADADWDLWKRDVRAALDWLRPQVVGPLGLWGLRLGAALAADVAQDRGSGIKELVLWQPVVVGDQFLTQFLRLRLAADMLAEGASQAGVRQLREQLREGTAVEVAGYDLHPRLASKIQDLRLGDLVPSVERVHCLEVTSGAEHRLSPATQRAMDAWKQRGLDVRASVVEGAPFWSTVEVTECESLRRATLDSLVA